MVARSRRCRALEHPTATTLMHRDSERIAAEALTQTAMSATLRVIRYWSASTWSAYIPKGAVPWPVMSTRACTHKQQRRLGPQMSAVSPNADLHRRNSEVAV